MKIASWNINSIKVRLPLIEEWVRETQPDIILLQETKCQNESFPQEFIEDLGYNVALHGQKTFNGVAILSKFPLEDIVYNLPTFEDPQARYIEAFTGGVRVASVYAPNGSMVGSEKYKYKLSFYKHLEAHLKTLLTFNEPLIVGGDYNVAPTDADVYDPKKWEGDVLVSAAERASFQAILDIGLFDAVRALYPEDRANKEDWYTWWDYRQGSWRRNAGLRIDHLLLSHQAKERLKSVGIDRTLRSKERPSDHAPIWCEV
jgi:exodeoxyribonuclease III